MVLRMRNARITKVKFHPGQIVCSCRDVVCARIDFSFCACATRELSNINFTHAASFARESEKFAQVSTFGPHMRKTRKTENKHFVVRFDCARYNINCARDNLICARVKVIICGYKVTQTIVTSNFVHGYENVAVDNVKHNLQATVTKERYLAQRAKTKPLVGFRLLFQPVVIQQVPCEGYHWQCKSTLRVEKFV